MECGKICTAHGVHGAVKVESWCDTPAVLAKQNRVFLADGAGYKECRVITASVSTRFVLMQLDAFGTREAAQAARDTVLYLKREDIPVASGAVLIADMIGLPVKDVDTGVTYGTLAEVNDGVQGKLYTVKTEKGDVIFPGIPEFVKEIDTERGIFVHTIPGFFD